MAKRYNTDPDQCYFVVLNVAEMFLVWKKTLFKINEIKCDIGSLMVFRLCLKLYVPILDIHTELIPMSCLSNKALIHYCQKRNIKPRLYLRKLERRFLKSKNYRMLRVNNSYNYMLQWEAKDQKLFNRNDNHLNILLLWFLQKPHRISEYSPDMKMECIHGTLSDQIGMPPEFRYLYHQLEKHLSLSTL